METSPRSGDWGETTLRSDCDSAVAADLRALPTRAGGIALGVTAGAASRGRVRPPASENAVRQMLATAADQLLAEARAACRRDAVPASKQELIARIAARIGLSHDDVAENLRPKRQRPRPVAAGVDDPMVALAATILGRREHTVFLARRNAPPNDPRTLHELATQLGVSIERVYQLEASALHKLTTALR